MLGVFGKQQWFAKKNPELRTLLFILKVSQLVFSTTYIITVANNIKNKSTSFKGGIKLICCVTLCLWKGSQWDSG